MNLMPAFLRRRPVFEGDQYWAKRIPQMRMEESMTDVERAIKQMRRGDFLGPIEHPRDLDEGRPLQVPPTPDLFADGIEVAQAVLDWEQRAGQPIAPLIDHIRKALELRNNVEAKAKGDARAAEQEAST
jgi:hypothetical protein